VLIAGSVAVAGAIAFAVSRGSSDEPARSPVAQVASFSVAPSSASLPDAAARQRFVAAFSEGRSIIATLDLHRLRSFSLGSADDFSVVAAPAAKGGICYLDSRGRGTCIESFHEGAGMTEGYRRVNGGAKHNVISGLLPDGISKITFATNAGSFSTPVRHNVFQFVVPDQGPVISSYTLAREDGSTRAERWPAIRG
jgi:hypothetical protein